MSGYVGITVVDENGNEVRLRGTSDGSLAQSDAAFAVKVTTSGGYTYIGEAVPGTAQASAAWRCQRIDSSGTTTWADGDSLFNNVATDLTALSYS